MGTRRRGRALALPALLIACIAIGCGSQNDKEGKAADTSETQAQAQAPGQPGQAPGQLPPEAFEELAAAHCLIQYQGARNAGVEITRTKEEALKVAQDVSKRAKKGDDFVGLVREYSDDPTTAQRGGELGIHMAKDVIPPLSQAIQALQVGQVSDPVETPFGYHVIVRKKVEKITVRHILIQYRGSMKAPETVTRTKDEAAELCRSLHEQLAKGGDFAALASEHTDDPLSKPQGGVLPAFGRGMFIAPFEDAAFALEVGALSDCIETDFGYHIIKREG